MSTRTRHPKYLPLLVGPVESQTQSHCRFSRWIIGGDQPKLDREQIKQALLTAVDHGKVKWEKKVVSSERDGERNVVLRFNDGTTAKGF